MIKLIREGSTKYPWLLKIIILLIAVTFMIGMGWFGYESSLQPNAVAIVGPYTVSLEEFRRTYTRMYRFYKDELKQELVDEKELKQQVIQSMVDKKVWLVTADEWDIGISPDTLRYEIRKRKEFQTDGTFDPGLYHRLLTQNRYSPKDFEKQLTRDLQTQHAQIIVQDVATLNPSEVQEADELAERQTAGMEDEAEKDRIRKRIRLQILFQKKQRALQAFQAAKRMVSDVEIRQEYL